ncbi:hypothetical protein P3T37_001277 [Kitasatospora sp. MAA4]|uniref:hypothetical protein n=1 Tax=Kitasatospora sp. MAA4 TaxID=3035093 RepID=UPI0024765C31|nr:hypothetical protein [Kitasatospora sp. MAA4]MDH6131903.1 hypothetical protein [Kitasatospora sp. MAA4]
MRRTPAALSCAIALVLPTAWPAWPATRPEPRLLGLSITVPTSASLGSAAPGGVITGHLGAVTVDDTGVVAAWTTTVTATNFTTGAGAPAQTIGKGSVSYWSGPATAKTGLGTATPGQATAAQAQSLSASRTAFSLANGTLVTSVTWNPTLIVAVPASAVGGGYTGTVTHSVA